MLNVNFAKRKEMSKNSLTFSHYIYTDNILVMLTKYRMKEYDDFRYKETSIHALEEQIKIV